MGHNDFLITGYFFDGYTGSMMHICEIAKQLSADGWKVTIAAMQVTDEIKAYVSKLGNVQLYSVWDIPEKLHFERALCYHFPVLTVLLTKNILIDRILFGCLSAFEPLESPLPAVKKKGYYLQVHSEILAEQIAERFEINRDRIVIVPNLAPDEYFRERPRTNSRLERIAIISNHVPPELREAVSLLRQNEYKTDIYGVSDNYIPVSRDLLEGYDVIVTIGKTVQYALASGIPAFEYDRFGGSGYVTPGNVADLESHNFSGRFSSRKLSARELYEEIVGNYQTACAGIADLAVYAEKYRASAGVRAVFENDAYYMPVDNREEFYSFTDEQMELCTHIVRENLLSAERIAESSKALTESNKALAESSKVLAEKLETVQKAYSEISNAFFWKITKPFRRILDCIKRIV